jgi:hypothetical protein
MMGLTFHNAKEQRKIASGFMLVLVHTISHNFISSHNKHELIHLNSSGSTPVILTICNTVFFYL